MALRIERSSRMSASVSPACASRTSARADRRAMSSQIGWPDGDSAACGTVSPRASATTCDVAAVPEELAAAARAAAGPAAQLGGLGQRQLAVGEAGPDRLDLAGILAFAGRQGHAAGDEHARQVLRPGQGHHHGRQALVAGRDAQHALAPGQRADQPAEDDRRVVAIRQAVHHPGRALRPPVARVGDHPRERHDVQRAQLLGRLADEQADLPVARVIAQRDRLAVRGPQAALRAQDQVGIAGDLARRPAHAGVLGQAEEVARRPVPQHLAGQRQRARGPLAGGRDLVDGGIVRVDQRLEARDGSIVRPVPSVRLPCWWVVKRIPWPAWPAGCSLMMTQAWPRQDRSPD